MIQKPLLMWDLLLSKSKLALTTQSKPSEMPVLTKMGQDGSGSIAYMKLPMFDKAATSEMGDTWLHPGPQDVVTFLPKRGYMAHPYDLTLMIGHMMNACA